MFMRPLLAVAVAVGLTAQSAAAQAPASSSPSAPPSSPAGAPAVSERVAEEPSVEERRIVAYVSTGVAVASLATGITMGLLAQAQFDCAKDIVACNGTLANPVVGEELFDLRSEIEQKALFADMAYLFAGAATVVATVGYLRGFVFIDEEPAAAPVATIVVPVLPAQPAVAQNLAPVATDVVVTR